MSSAVLPTERTRKQTAVTTLLLVLSGESVLFGTLLMAYLYLRDASTTWPPLARDWTNLAVPLLVLTVLLGSELIAWRVWSVWRNSGDLSALRRGLVAGMALGLLFLAGQIFEFNRSGMRPSDAAFGGLFFALMLFHGLHVLGGLALKATNLVRAGWGDFDRLEHTALDIGFYFWSYVVAVWVVLFVALYLA